MTEDHTGQDRYSGQYRPQDGLDRLTVAEAAERLGVTQDAVRKRMARGTIRHFKEDGRLYVYLDTFEKSSKTIQDEGQDAASNTVQDAGQDKYVAALEDQIQFLRRELERKDAILLRLTERIPELAAAPEPQSAPETAPDTSSPSPRPDTVEAQEGVQEQAANTERSVNVERPTEETARRPWWVRWFGG